MLFAPKDPLHPLLPPAAILLLIKSQAVKKTTLPDVLRTINETRWPDKRFAVEEVQKTVGLVCRIAGRLGLLNSCIVRTLMTARLLKGRSGLMLHIGVHKVPSVHHQGIGHAWVELEGKNVSDFPWEVSYTRDVQIVRSFDLSGEK